MSKKVMARLTKGADLLEEITRVCRENEIERGTIQVIGALERATLGYYHQDRQEYESHDFDKHLEVLSGLGNVSLKDGEPFVHLHLVLGDSECNCVGGHAYPGCTIFAAEAVVLKLKGDPLVRVYDEPTGLFLWGEDD